MRAPSGRLIYAAPGTGDADRLRAIGAAMRRYAIGVEAAGGLVIVTTPSGYASALAQAIDEGAHPSIAGTLAGDNTIFIAPRTGRRAGALGRAARAPKAGFAGLGPPSLFRRRGRRLASAPRLQLRPRGGRLQGSAPRRRGIRAAGIRSCGFPLDEREVAAFWACCGGESGRLQGSARAAEGGRDPSGGNPLPRIPAREQEK